ncbi:MAG: hypothetical protein HC880_16725, partial [Bacteroidia bacterium]|nr:hypothetical protein [Bacteroidia bacterium]
MIEQLQVLFDNDSPWASLLGVGLILLAAFVIHFIIFRVLKRLSRRWDAIPYEVIGNKVKQPTL